ncbi:DUF2516 family protein [Brachybacterium hainanense]|uniref:DUF2516 family protein n=1 Tax=Brachybacterium hainanense TaxID=1541174 RepID=A0ABV6RC20_9MICO
MIGLFQTWIFAVLALVLFGVEIWAFINAARYSPAAYVAASKRSKTFWMVLTGAAMILGFLSLPYPIGRGSSNMLLVIVGIVIAGVFLADVLPALRQVMDRARRNRY